MKVKQTILFATALLCLFLSREAFSQQFVKDLNISEEQLQVQFTENAPQGFLLEIGGPGSYYWRDAVYGRKAINFNNIRESGEAFPDGQYTLQISPVYVLSDDDNVKIRELRDLGDMKGVRKIQEKYNIPESSDFYNYSFRIQQGKFVTPGLPEGGLKKPSTLGAREIKLQEQGLYASLNNKSHYDVAFTGKTWNVNVDDQVFFDDLIVQGSICAGQDCNNGESFGFDTVRLKENNLRIRFQDTSNSASFPTTDWQITANESSNGGKNKFSIDDIDSGRTPFTIEATAPSNSLYVDSGGDVGFGTNTPVVQMHQKDGNTPTLRLEQDGSSGFSAQTWDLAGNEANFFIRDATNGSTLPLQIKPGAPTGSVFINASGVVSLKDYGQGNNTGTAVHLLGVDASGNITEEALGGGGGGGSSVWSTNGTTAFYNTGSVGIGTDTPSSDLTVAGDIDGRVRISIENDNSGTGALSDFLMTTGSLQEGFIFQQFSNSNTSSWSGLTLGGFSRIRAKGANSSGIIMTTDGTDPIIFGTDDAEKVRINGNGRVGINCDNPSTELHVNGTISTTAASVMNSVACASDARFKTNVVTLEGSLGNILRMRGVTYDWKTNEFPEKHFNEGTQLGFIAQELEVVLPEVVQTDKKGYKSVDYSRLTPVLVEAVKEQQDLIDAQKSEIELLKAELNELRELKAQVAELTQLIKKEEKNTENIEMGEDD